MERGVAEHRGVVDPARERRGGLREVRGALGDGGVGGVARYDPRPAVRGVAGEAAGVAVDRDDDITLGQQAVDDGAAHPARAAGDDVGVHGSRMRAQRHRYTLWIWRIDRFRACLTRAGS